MKKINEYIIPYLSKFSIKIAVYFFIVTILSILSVFIPYFTGKFIDILTYATTEFNKILEFCLIFFFIAIFKIILDFIKQRIYINLQMKISYDMLSDLIYYYQKLPYLFTQKYESAYITQRMNVDINNLLIGYLSFICSIISNFIFTVFSLFLIGSFNLYLAIAMVVASFVYYIGYILTKDKVYEITKVTNELSVDFFEKSNLQVSNIRITKIDVLFKELKELLNISFNKLLFNSLIKQKIDFLYETIDTTVILIMQLLIFIYGGFKVYTGELTIGNFTIISMLFSNIINSISFYFNLGQDVLELKVSLSRIFYFYKEKNEHNGKLLIENINSVELKNINFAYEKNTIFSGFSFKFEKDNIYLIKGMNGSGKTTLVDIILGLFVNEIQGEIIYNDKSIINLDMYAIRKKNISVVNQDFKVIDVVEFNLDNYNYDIIQELSLLFELEEVFIFSEKYFKLKHNNLSKGQYQKVSLILALSKKSSIFIFDEPSSALDINSKDILVRYIEKLKNEKIIIIVTHDEIFDNISNYTIDL